MAFSGHKATFEFVKHYVKRLPSFRTYQTIRVIRPQPQGQANAASLIKDVPTGKLLVFAIISGIGESSKRFVRKRTLVIYQSQNEGIKVMMML